MLILRNQAEKLCKSQVQVCCSSAINMKVEEESDLRVTRVPMHRCREARNYSAAVALAATSAALLMVIVRLAQQCKAAAVAWTRLLG